MTAKQHPDDAAIIERFKEIHEGWNIDIEAPPEGPSTGAIHQPQGSGLIRYAFGTDERGRFLEYYSFHRIWGDSHRRIYATGDIEQLNSLGTNYVITGDPDKDRLAAERLHAYNQKLLAELEEAGLLSGGPVPNSFQINAAIVTGAIDPDEKD